MNVRKFAEPCWKVCTKQAGVAKIERQRPLSGGDHARGHSAVWLGGLGQKRTAVASPDTHHGDLELMKVCVQLGDLDACTRLAVSPTRDAPAGKEVWQTRNV